MMKNDNNQIEIVCCLELGDTQVYNHLVPIAQHPRVSRVWIVRSHGCGYGDIPKSEYVLIPGRFKPWRWLRMYRACRRLCKRPQVTAVVSFNPIPYGLIVGLAGHGQRKAVHYGFIGSDWYKYTLGRFGWLLRPLLRHGDFFTVTGPAMKQERIERGVEPEPIEILPHSIDLNRFVVNRPSESKYDFLFVGQLIKRKRLDLILTAFARVAKCDPEMSLCIVGDGPLRPSIQEIACSLDIGKNVHFAGYRTDVCEYMKISKNLVMASDMEGFPFSIVEALSSGVVPISTPVGTIPDLIQNGVNGLLVPTGDADALAKAMARLVEDRQLYERLRQNALAMRNKYSYETATTVWDTWLRSLLVE